ncbi:tellurium resistance protein [Tabrizicola sp. J26]|uniref:SLAC1 family transporter n=1 Tax=Alitabrizicola rongguiensis TaxID=2909234 RepID=UPI001F2FC5CC|nr:tellurium resistance protein [Tabrizicola rongguiensis]MCF1709853.1 tellurium resistance protein [Tabrizicola rongguiensis]
MTEPTPPRRYFPPPPPLAPKPKPGLFRRVPPAIFPPILGALGLGLVWRQSGWMFGLPDGLAEMFLGAMTLLWLFAVLAYCAKIARRPGVLAEDLTILPGRAGVSALMMTIYQIAMVLGPYAGAAARGLLFGGLALHLALTLWIIGTLARATAAQREVTPVWHLTFVGPILGAVAAQMLGLEPLARVIFWVTLPLAAGIGAVSLVQIVRRVPPAPLRPLLAIHLAPLSLFGMVALGLGWPQVALVFAALAVTLLLALVVSLKWLLAAGFTALWGAFTFPLAAFARLVLGLMPGSLAGGAVLVAATMVILPILVRLLQDWAKGSLAARTNAAEA